MSLAKIHRLHTLLALMTGILAFTPMVTHARGVLEKPIYNEETKSYFEMIDYRPTTGGYGLRWSKAEKIAEERTLGGVRGHLAVIRTPQTELFLKVNFRPDLETWFGLYFNCKTKALEWVTGESLKATDYGNFDVNNWYRGGNHLLCRGVERKTRYPAFLDMGGDKRWAIKTPEKLYYYFIVEYPTGKRIEADHAIGAVEAITVPDVKTAPAAPASEETSAEEAPAAE